LVGRAWVRRRLEHHERTAAGVCPHVTSGRLDVTQIGDPVSERGRNADDDHLCAFHRSRRSGERQVSAVEPVPEVVLIDSRNHQFTAAQSGDPDLVDVDARNPESRPGCRGREGQTHIPLADHDNGSRTVSDPCRKVLDVDGRGSHSSILSWAGGALVLSP
jgi:hypothetical protein